MSRMIKLDAERISRLLPAIRDGLAASGYVSQSVERLGDVAPEEWRGAARAAARQLNRPVRTYAKTAALHAVLVDWPRDERERSIDDTTMRAAMEGLAKAYIRQP